MTQLSEHVAHYLELRRGLGFKLEKEGRLLADFASFIDAGAGTVTVNAALAWAALPEAATPIWIAQRLTMVRQFARYLHTIDHAAEVPPAALLPLPRITRPTPFLYSPADIAVLIAAARTLPHPLRAATFATLIGLLAATGMRGGEAMRLDRNDIDCDHGTLTIRDGKFGKSRLLQLHASTIDALSEYRLQRERLCPAPATASFLVSTTGNRLTHATVQPTFRQLLRRVGIGPRTGARPHLHSLRHTFAVRTLLGWYRDGQDVQARLLALSTYLGHTDPNATYWYLSAAPELLTLAAARLETADEGRS